LSDAADDLAMLRGDVAGLRSKAEAASNGTSNDESSRRELQRLLRQAQQLQESVERMSRRLMRLTADGAARSTARAADRLGQSTQGGEGGASDDALRAAERDLEQAQAELAETLRQAEAELAAEQVADMLTTLQSLANRQQQVVEETQRLDDVRQSRREWTFGQLQSLASLAEEEKLLGEETLGAVEKIVGLSVVRAALEIAAQDMQRAATGLAQRDTRDATQRSARAAHDRLEMVLAALGEDPRAAAGAPAADDSAGGGAGGGQDGQGAQEENSIDLAELRLLKLMQTDLRERTAATETAVVAGDIDQEVVARRYAELANEQGQIAALIGRLLDETTPGQNEPITELPSLDDALQQDDSLPELDF
jgi:hypothetical protein